MQVKHFEFLCDQKGKGYTNITMQNPNIVPHITGNCSTTSTIDFLSSRIIKLWLAQFRTKYHQAEQYVAEVEIARTLLLEQYS